MRKVSQEELQKSLEYLEEFEKGQTSMEVDETANGGQTEEIAQLKKELKEHVNKAKMCKAKLDALEKGETSEEEPETEPVEGEKPQTSEEEPETEPVEGEKPQTSEEESETPMEKGTYSAPISSPAAFEELRKSIINEIREELSSQFETLKKAKDQEIIDLKSKVESLENEPVKKSIVKASQGIALEKAIKGETSEEGKTLLSRKFQKSKISNILFQAFESETDEIKKSMYGDAVAQFESTSNGYISPAVLDDLYKSKNIQIID